MSRRWAGALVLAGWCGASVGIPASAEESLAEAAIRTRVRRPQTQSHAKIYTNADLAKYGPSAQTQPLPEGLAEQVAPVPQTQAFIWDGADWMKLESEWRERFATARRRVREAESRAWRESIKTVFYGGVPVQMRVRELVETEELLEARRALADLQDQLRRSGKPPGWGRE